MKMETQHTNGMLWDAAQAVLRGKFIVINVHIKKKEWGLPWWRSG